MLKRSCGSRGKVRWRGSLSSRRPLARLPFSSLGALAEVLLPRGAPLGVQPGDCRGFSGILGSVRSGWTARHRQGAGVRGSKTGCLQKAWHQGTARRTGLRGNGILSLRGQQTLCPSGAGAARGSLALLPGRGCLRGAGLLSGSVPGGPCLVHHHLFRR